MLYGEIRPEGRRTKDGRRWSVWLNGRRVGQIESHTGWAGERSNVIHRDPKPVVSAYTAQVGRSTIRVDAYTDGARKAWQRVASWVDAKCGEIERVP